MTPKKLLLRAALAALSLACLSSRAATLNVAPSAYATAEGGTSATYPFGQTSIHYQQVYAASQFSGGGTITEIAFRPDGSYAGSTPLMPFIATSATIILSTTSAAPGALSTQFSSNLGSDQTTVYTGPLALSTSYTGATGGPNAFDLRVRLATPFAYQPANGNLIIDIVLTNSSGTVMTALDAETVTSSPVASRAYALSASATQATTTDNKALVTQFVFGAYTVPQGGGLRWLVFNPTVTGVNGQNAALAQHFFNNARTLIAGNPLNDPVPSGFGNAIPLANYTSFAKFQSDLLAGNINTIYAGNMVMYDNENWSKTPSNEQADPSDYTMLFANLAHAYGYGFVSAPATNIVQSMPGYNASLRLYPQYLSFDLPQICAGAPAELYEIQAQGTQQDSGTFVPFIQNCVQAAQSVNPSVMLFAGISTDASGQVPTAQQLATAVTETTSYVTGYWLNCPDSGYLLASQALQILENDGY